MVHVDEAAPLPVEKRDKVGIFHRNASHCDTIVVQFSTNVVQMDR
jgi:hypothetical protein